MKHTDMGLALIYKHNNLFLEVNKFIRSHWKSIEIDQIFISVYYKSSEVWNAN